MRARCLPARLPQHHVGTGSPGQVPTFADLAGLGEDLLQELRVHVKAQAPQESDDMAACGHTGTRGPEARTPHLPLESPQVHATPAPASPPPMGPPVVGTLSRFWVTMFQGTVQAEPRLGGPL